MVKTDTEPGPKNSPFNRELRNHRLADVASCQYIRALCDVVGLNEDKALVDSTLTAKDPPCMVFEWMEHDLRAVPSDRFRQNSNLPKLIAKTVLSATALLKSQYGVVHTGEHLCLPSSVIHQLLNN